MLEGDHEQDGGGVWYCLVTDVSDRDVGDLVVMYRHQSVSQSVSLELGIKTGGWTVVVDVWTM